MSAEQDDANLSCLSQSEMESEGRPAPLLAKKKTAGGASGALRERVGVSEKRREDDAINSEPFPSPRSRGWVAKRRSFLVRMLMAPLRPWPWLWKHVNQLHTNGTLVQAVGVPLRHMFALYGIYLCVCGAVGWRTYLWAFALWPISGCGVTAGAHRLWTHQSYKPTPLMEAMLIVMFSIADQGSIAGWALTHQLHHRASDTEWDPHNRNAGFWHAHFGWIFSLRCFHVRSEDYSRIVGALSSLVLKHDDFCAWWDPFWSHVFPGLVAASWGEGFTGFFVAGALRWAFVQHVTFFVNSVAHGDRDDVDCKYAFDSDAKGIGPRVSLLVTMLALGEGWHDYHHLFPWDYAAAELDAWHQWNPTKVFIDTCFFFGLCDGRRRCSQELQAARRNQILAKTEQAEYIVAGPPFLRYRVPKNVAKVVDSDVCSM
eukprot:TRINITY_DN17775_c0_g1_i1.p1 TRINITY_DN17775_c0_g1~~TRINITY_DN17775_c0_g1_i1.p1  ORF type:complete len:428 (+),score=49.65 TRINITY_DN17775_c0_g1_i1:180-1463(+)